jgi:predicted restriction endonuclease
MENTVTVYKLEDILELYTYNDSIFNYENTIKYSQLRDLKTENLLDYDAINNRNLRDKEITINRLVRDTNISRKLKQLYQNKCQLCGVQLLSANGDYMSEAHHIKPYNKTHQGDDGFNNLIVLCPNCHSQFDQLLYVLHPVTNEVHCIFEDDKYHLSKLEMNCGHTLAKEYLEYIWNIFFKKKQDIHKGKT